MSVPESLDRTGRDELSTPLPDPAVFADAYRKLAPRLVAFLLWSGAPYADAAECAQEALVEAYRRWSSIEHPHAWCRKVASRLYARRLASLEDPTGDPGATGTPLLAEETPADIGDQHRQVLHVLAQLPLRQRQIMAWTYDGATPTEIADALKITPDAAHASLKKARATLRSHLDENGGEL
jgi:RNA polymerase sigma factor (sigma-70 family)